jgi:hypothetical protein
VAKIVIGKIAVGFDHRDQFKTHHDKVFYCYTNTGTISAWKKRAAPATHWYGSNVPFRRRNKSKGTF